MKKYEVIDEIITSTFSIVYRIKDKEENVLCLKKIKEGQ